MERRRAGRRSALLETARAVLLREGLEGFTLAAVAEEADLSKAALFYYFDSKEALVAALAEASLQAGIDAMLAAVEEAETGIEALAALMRAYVAHHRDDLDAFRIFDAWSRLAGVQRRLLDTAVYPGAARINDALEAKLRRDRRAGRLHPDAHPRRLANVAYYAAHGLVSVASSLQALGGRTRFELDELCEEACGALVRGASAQSAAGASRRPSTR